MRFTQAFRGLSRTTAQLASIPFTLNVYVFFFSVETVLAERHPGNTSAGNMAENSSTLNIYFPLSFPLYLFSKLSALLDCSVPLINTIGNSKGVTTWAVQRADRCAGRTRLIHCELENLETIEN